MSFVVHVTLTNRVVTFISNAPIVFIFVLVRINILNNIMINISKNVIGHQLFTSSLIINKQPCHKQLFDIGMLLMNMLSAIGIGGGIVRITMVGRLGHWQYRFELANHNGHGCPMGW